jgi:hypothetical protein
MKVWVWSVFAVLALLWTLGVWAGVELLQWGLQWLGAAPHLDAAGALGTLRVPAWLTLWIDVTWLQALLESVRWALEGLQQGGPLLASLGQALAAWLVPLGWLTWGLGLLTLLALAALSHALVARPGRSGGRLPPPSPPGLGGASAA